MLFLDVSDLILTAQGNAFSPKYRWETCSRELLCGCQQGGFGEPEAEEGHMGVWLHWSLSTQAELMGFELRCGGIIGSLLTTEETRGPHSLLFSATL